MRLVKECKRSLFSVRAQENVYGIKTQKTGGEDVVVQAVAHHHRLLRPHSQGIEDHAEEERPRLSDPHGLGDLLKAEEREKPSLIEELQRFRRLIGCKRKFIAL
ncbi:MAG: hypothetical protein QXY39_05330, partial [Thermofilaceae archaeon]